MMTRALGKRRLSTRGGNMAQPLNTLGFVAYAPDIADDVRRPRIMRRLAGVTVGLTLVICLLMSGAAWADVVTFGPDDCAFDSRWPDSTCGTLAATMLNLEAGDTLQLEPGTYEIGFFDLRNRSTAPVLDGQSDNPIVITAEDPANPPLLHGWIALWGVRYLTIDHIRFQAGWSASSHGGPGGGLAMLCGVGWKLQNSEFFGAADTGSVANLLVDGRGVTGTPGNDGACPGEPRGFSISYNSFHHPYIGCTPGTSTDSIYHNIYANFEGTYDEGTGVGSGGSIAHNIFEGFKCGAGIKLGTGSESRPTGPWGVTIERNTFYDGVRAVVTQNDIRRTTFKRNLTDKIVYPRSINPHIPFALGNLPAFPAPYTNTIAKTYAARNLNEDGLVWGPILDGLPGELTDNGDNLFRPGDDPAFNCVDPTWAATIAVTGAPEACFTPANSTVATNYGWTASAK
jgi:hypothetical protein